MPCRKHKGKGKRKKVYRKNGKRYYRTKSGLVRLKGKKKGTTYSEISDYVMVYCRPGMVTQLPCPVCVCPPHNYWYHLPKILYYIYVVTTL